MPSRSSGGSHPVIPKTVNRQVLFSWPNNAIPVGLPGTAPMRIILSVKVLGGMCSSWLA
jgi:hypothetical protein